MALLNQIIPPQNFEIIRDRIPVILVDEIANQFTLTSDTDLQVSVFGERIVPFDAANMPVINVLFSNGAENQQTTANSSNIYTFFIDIYTKAKSTATERGGKASAYHLHKLLGVCRAILENPQYRTLNFPLPSLESTAIKEISIADPKNNQDANSIMMGRLTFECKIREGVQLLPAGTIKESTTVINIEETAEGYKYNFITP